MKVPKKAAVSPLDAFARVVQGQQAASIVCFDQTMLNSSGARATPSLNAGYSRYAMTASTA